MPAFEVQIEHRWNPNFTLTATFEGRACVTALFGPSGSGKTTILNCIAGLVVPNAGRIRVGGRTLYDSSTRVNIPARHRRIGYVFQDLHLFPHLSVEANLRFGSRPHGIVAFDAVVEV